MAWSKFQWHTSLKMQKKVSSIFHQTVISSSSNAFINDNQNYGFYCIALHQLKEDAVRVFKWQGLFPSFWYISRLLHLQLNWLPIQSWIFYTCQAALQILKGKAMIWSCLLHSSSFLQVAESVPEVLFYLFLSACPFYLKLFGNHLFSCCCTAFII